jgi:hypothetical protein
VVVAPLRLRLRSHSQRQPPPRHATRGTPAVYPAVIATMPLFLHHHGNCAMVRAFAFTQSDPSGKQCPLWLLKLVPASGAPALCTVGVFLSGVVSYPPPPPHHHHPTPCDYDEAAFLSAFVWSSLRVPPPLQTKKQSRSAKSQEPRTG